MSSVEALKDSREHNRYRIAYRVHRMIVMMEQKSYSMREMSKELNVSIKTAYRMLRGLESMGVPFKQDGNCKWSILK